MAWIHRNKCKDFIYINCGGAIISDRHILSSASCIGDVKDEDGKTVTTILESLSSVKIGDVYEVSIEHVIFHPDYKTESVYNDLAILQTKEKIEFSENVAPIALSNIGVTKWHEEEVNLLAVQLPTWRTPMTQVNKCSFSFFYNYKKKT